MSRKSILVGTIVAVSFWAQGVSAEESFNYTVALESATIPTLDADGVIQGDQGATFEFKGKLNIASSGVTDAEGVQGWSLGVRNEGIEILSVTVDGTVSAATDKGGLVNGGFVVNLVIDPTKNEGKTGMTQAVVLSFTEAIYLPNNAESLVGLNTYRATVGAADSTATLVFVDGLVGKGQAVPNNVTFKGLTKIPTLGSRTITIKKNVTPVPETGNCADGIDNDLDLKTDCDDEDCASDPVCPQPEICNDTIDNDKDGKTDCADEDCTSDPVCPHPEICNDTIDNDLDLKTDCDDEDCASDPICTSTGGFDLVVNAAGSIPEAGKNVVEIDGAAGTTFEAPAYVVPFGDAQTDGAQGWSISVAHDKAALDIQSTGFPTIQGTDAVLLFSGGFEKTQVVDPAKNGGQAGYVSAVVLSFTEPVALDPSKAQSIVRAQYSVAASATDVNFPTTIRFLDGLVGLGQPVPNVITVKGNTVTPGHLISLEIKKGTVIQKRFARGDANDDGKVNIADPIWIINELVRSGPPTACKGAADANDDGLVDLSDAMYLIQWRFLGGIAPTAPFPACGNDPTDDALECPAGSVSHCPAA